MSKPTVLITGISGFIAKHCAVEMLNAGYPVRGTLRSLTRSTQVRDTLAQHADTTRLEFAQADLESDAGWNDALAGCAHVLHLASPFPASQPKDEQELIRPAVQGTLRVLRAASAAGIERLVHTSSMVAVMYGHPHARTAPYTEADWTQVNSPGVTPYAKSKTLAEQAARDFMKGVRLGHALRLGQSRIGAGPGARPGHRRLGRDHPDVHARQVPGCTETVVSVRGRT